MKLHYLTDKTGYFDNPSVIGLYRLVENQCILIDTGLDDDAAKKVIKILTAEGLTVTHVINTHSHADHCGGNSLFQKRTDAVFYASAGEKGYIECPSIEPHYLFGAFPPKVLRAKFLQAKPSIINHVIESDHLMIENETFGVIRLPGHSQDMVGIMTPDKVFFVGDAVFDKAIVEKYSVIYNYNLRGALESLDYLKTVEAKQFVLSHGGPRLSIDDDIESNRKALLELNAFILEQSESEITKNDLHKRMSSHFEINENIPTYYLNDSLLSSHLGYLIEENQLTFEVKDGEVVYRRV